MGIKVNEITTVQVLTTDGQLLHKGDCIVLRIKTEDIVGKYVGMDNGYFVTATMDGSRKNKYRISSVTSCRLIEPIQLKEAPKANKIAMPEPETEPEAENTNAEEN